MRILFYGDMLCYTGFAKVSHNIISQLRKDEHNIMGIGINYHGDPVELNFPEFKDVPIFPCNEDDILGKRRLVSLLNDNNLEFDVLFILGDLFNMLDIVEPIEKAKKEKGLKVVLYFPVDASIKKSWTKVIDMADIAITYTNFGSKECLKFNRNVINIPHGTDVEIFHHMDKIEMRKKYFPYIPEDTKILMNVNVNQPRKDLCRSIEVFYWYHGINPNSYLYMHCLPNDARGYNLLDYIANYHPELGEYIIFPDLLHDNYTEERMAELYNCADIIFTTSLGEGWGLSITEAQACGIPVVVPDHTSLSEIVDRWGGIKSSISGFVINKNDNTWRRPVTNEVSMANNILGALVTSPDIKVPITWDEVGKQWRELINQLKDK